MVFSYSAPLCPNTCSDPSAEQKCDGIIEACVCKEGFILSGDKCVPEDQCGCQLGNRYYDVSTEAFCRVLTKS